MFRRTLLISIMIATVLTAIVGCSGGSVGNPPAGAQNISNPTIASLSISSAMAGSPAFSLTVTGTNFTAQSQVNWSGPAANTNVVLNTTFASATQLTAMVGAQQIANPGTASVTVVNAGQQSNAVPFNVTSTAPPPGTRMPLGTNVSGMDDFSTEFTFVDVFRNSRPWFSGTRTIFQDQQTLDLDANGWVHSLAPGQVARALMFWDLSAAPGSYPAGQYVVTYSGQGTLDYAPSAQVISRAPGREVIDVDPARHGGIGLFITSTNPNDYLRNIQVIGPGSPTNGQRFTQAFLDQMGSYRVIRFMNWMLGQNNNNIMQAHWSDRPTPDEAQWSVRGVPVEIMVELANTVHANPWFNIPHLADDDYVRNFAHIVAQQLDPTLTVYVEHSNEVWNGQYPQHAYAVQQGLALGLSTNPAEAAIRYHALRSRQIFDIFQQELPPNRLVRVLGSFVGSTAVTNTALTFADTPAHVDAIAIAPYFGILPNDLARVQTMTVQQLIQDLQTNAIPTVMNQVRQQVAIGRQFGIPVIAYEGGQSLQTSGGGALQGDPTLEALFTAANRDPQFGSLYSTYLQSWNDAGGGLFVHYTNCFRYGPFGRFGSLEYISQPRTDAPKFDALQRWIEGH